MRLDKFLVDCGLGSRSEVKHLLKTGRIFVNDQLEKSPKCQVEPKSDQISFDGNLLKHEEFVYYMLNKPKGALSATEDEHALTVLDLLDETARQKKVFPVGRLDKDTHGLLLLTNNGPLAHVLLSPKRHVDKSYKAQIAGIMTPEDQETFAKGIALKDFTCLPARLEVIAVDEKAQKSTVEITLAEGKFHQVKRMVIACGKEVTDLQRLSMGPLKLDPTLALGDYRRLTKDELTALETFGVPV